MVRTVRVCGIWADTRTTTHPFPVLCYRSSIVHVAQIQQVPLTPDPSLGLFFFFFFFITGGSDCWFFSRLSHPKRRNSILSGQKRGLVFLLILRFLLIRRNSTSGATNKESWLQLTWKMEVSCLEAQAEKTRAASGPHGLFLEWGCCSGKGGPHHQLQGSGTEFFSGAKERLMGQNPLSSAWQDGWTLFGAASGELMPESVAENSGDVGGPEM